MTNDGDPLVCGTGRMTMIEDGLFAEATAVPPNPTVLLTQDQADARYVRPAVALNLATGITGATGGGASRLDGLATVALPTYYALLVRESGPGLTAWMLEPDSDDASGARSVVPLDHDAASNPRTWRQRL